MSTVEGIHMNRLAKFYSVAALVAIAAFLFASGGTSRSAVAQTKAATSSMMMGTMAMSGTMMGTMSGMMAGCTVASLYPNFKPGTAAMSGTMMAMPATMAMMGTMAMSGTMSMMATMSGTMSSMMNGGCFVAQLSGKNEVPGPGDTDGAGWAAISISGQQVCFDVAVNGITLPAAAAHIHKGAAAVAGPVVIDAKMPPGANGTSQSCVIADAALIADIVANPSGYYYNVHTSDFPNGAMRGQLSKSGMMMMGTMAPGMMATMAATK